MYALIRVFIFLLISVVLLTKVKFNRTKRITVIVVTVLLCVFSNFVPAENLLVDFSSPEKVYKYMYFGNDDIKTTVYGEESAMVIAEKGENAYSILFVPESDNGWNIGNNLYAKSVCRKTHNKIIIDVKKYSNTDDYYITVKGIDPPINKITDSNNSAFVSFNSDGSESENQITFYYTAIPNFNEKYWVEINGERINFGE